LAGTYAVAWVRVRDLRIVGERQFVPLPEVAGRDIVANGLDVPLLATVGEPRAVILGTRRAAALKALLHRDSRVPVMVAGKSSEVVSWMAADSAHRAVNEMPWTWMQRGRVAGWLLRDIAVRNGEPSLVDALATYLGVQAIQVRNAWYLVRDFDRAQGSRKVQVGRAIEAVERGELLPQSATSRLREGRFPDPDAPPAPATMTLAEQVRALQALGGELTGLGLGIDALGPVHEGLTTEQRAELLVPLAEFRRTLTRLTRALAPAQTQGRSE
jgi:hypothetical protein